MTASVAFNTCRLKITIISQDEIKHRVCCYRRLFLATHKAAVTRKTRKQNFEKKCHHKHAYFIVLFLLLL